MPNDVRVRGSDESESESRKIVLNRDLKLVDLVHIYRDGGKSVDKECRYSGSWKVNRAEKWVGSGGVGSIGFRLLAQRKTMD